MPLDLPNTPIPGDSFTLPDGSEVVWDGEKWLSPSEAFLPLAGGVMLGPIILEPPYPLNQYEAGHKQYIDEMIMAQSYYQGLWWVKDNNPDLTPAVVQPLNGYSWLAQTEDPNIPELAPAHLPGIGGGPINSGDSIRWNEQALIYERVRGASMGSAEAMLMFLQLAGGRMRGRLILADGGLTDTHQATPKWYVDQVITAAGSEADLRFVNVGGDVMTGLLSLSNDPTVDLHSATKRYVDQSIASISLFQGVWFVAANNPDLNPAVVLPEHTYSWIAQTVDPNIPETVTAALPGLTGLLIAAGDHVVWNANTSAYVHIRGASLNAIEARAVFIEAAGDSMTGVLNLAADPIGDMEAVNKRYLDAQVASGLSQAEADLLYVSGVTPGIGLSGGGTSGDITLDVVQATQAIFGGGMIATNADIAAGTNDARLVTSLGLRSQLGADGQTLVTSAKTVVPAINELISTIAQLVGVLVFAGAYNGTTELGAFNGNGGIAEGQGVPLPAASATNYGAYLIITTGGPGGGLNEPAGAMEVQDWLVSDGAAWILLKFGPATVAYLPIMGGQMQGFISLHAEPVNAMHAATRSFVETAIGNAGTLTGVTAGAGLAGGGVSGNVTLSLVQAGQAVFGGGTVATAADIATGTLDTSFVSPLGLRSQLGAPGSSLVTSNKTVVPAINEIISTIAALAGVLVFAGGYDATTRMGVFNGNGGIPQGQAPLPAASATNSGAYLLVVMPGAGGGPNEPAGAMEVQDWLISDGVIWNLVKFGPTAVAFLPLTGGSLSGFLTLHAEPVNAMHAATRSYVDTAIGASGTITGITAGPGLTGGGTGGVITLGLAQATQAAIGGAEIATTVEIADGTLDTMIITPSGLRTQLGADGAILYTTNKTVVPAINELISTIAALVGVLVFAGAYNAQAGTGYFNGNGGIAQGENIPLPAPSTANYGAYLLVVMPGPGGGPNEPAGAMEVQDWLISDGVIWNLVKFGPTAVAFLPTTGGTMSGYIVLHADPTAAMHPVTRQYLEANSLSQAEADALYLTQAEADALFLTQAEADALFLTPAEADAAYVRLAGSVMTGFLTLNADPTANMHPVTLQYLNNNTLSQAEADTLFLTPAEGDLAYVRLAGSTMTGFLSLSADPTAPMHAVTKQFLEASLGAAGGGTITGVTAGNGLTGGGVTGNVTLSLVAPVSIANGGTNAITAPAALTSLGAVAKAGDLMSGNLSMGGTGIIYTGVGDVDAVAFNWDAVNSILGLWINGAYVNTVAIGPGGGLDQATADARYVNITGDVMSGPLTTTGLVVSGPGYIVINGANFATSDGATGFNKILAPDSNQAIFIGDGTTWTNNMYRAHGHRFENRAGTALWFNIGNGITQTGQQLQIALSGVSSTPLSLQTASAIDCWVQYYNVTSNWLVGTQASGEFWFYNVATLGLPLAILASGEMRNATGTFSSTGIWYGGLGAAANRIAFDWFGGAVRCWVDGIYQYPLANAGVYLPLAGGTLNNGGSDPLQILAPVGAYARIRYHVSSMRIWSAGTAADGNFMLADESANAVRTIFGMDGTLTNYGNITASGSMWTVSLTASASVLGAYLNSSGNVDVGGSIWAAGTITASGNMSCWDLVASNNISATVQVWGAAVVTNALTCYGTVWGSIVHGDSSVNTAQYNLRGQLFANVDAAFAVTTIAGPGFNTFYLYQTGTNYYDQNYHYIRTSGGSVTYALFNGAGSYNATGVWFPLSSAELKENIQPYTRGLTDLLALQPVSFRYLQGTPFADPDSTTRYGFIAEDIEPLIPEMVIDTEYHVDQGGTETRPVKAVGHGHLVFLLTNAVKELAAMNDGLTARVQALEAQIAAGTA